MVVYLASRLVTLSYSCFKASRISLLPMSARGWSDAKAERNFLKPKSFTRTRVNKTEDFYSVTAI